ncbi:hypothetical protein BKA70DRAFT_1298456 [Coprinopsis sp. MPI-PUGE-AT-0042]|nr:hypothetical protein BKA70DRAFT_1298456 [Coprinopsis sp. MPI-PUGE-AT-0042]
MYQPSDVEWDAYGTMFAASRFGGRFVKAALWGIQAFMVIDSISTYSTMPQERRKGHLRFLVFSCAILVAGSITLAFDLWEVFGNLFTAGPDGKSYIEAYRRNSKAKNSNLVMAILGGVMMDGIVVAGDILLLWRCSVMWRSKRWAIVIPSLACTGSIVSRIARMVMMSKTSYILEGPGGVTAMIAESLSVFMKVMVTCLILFQLPRNRFMISRSCPIPKPSRTYSRVAAILVESAAPLALFGVCYVTVTVISYYRKPEVLAQRGTLNALNEVSGSLYFAFSGLSPQMIIFRVLNGQSWKNAHESNEMSEKLSTTLRFARPGSTSTHNTEAEGALARGDVKFGSNGARISEEAGDRQRQWAGSNVT